jgi:carbonic anhydrase
LQKSLDLAKIIITKALLFINCPQILTSFFNFPNKITQNRREGKMKIVKFAILAISALSVNAYAEEYTNENQHGATPKAAQHAPANHAPSHVAPASHAPVAAGHEVHAPHWSYFGEFSADNWGQIAGNEVCKLGQVQSPINIPSKGAISAPLPPIYFNYQPTNGEVLNNGHTIQVNLKPGNSIILDGKSFNLLQFHFHSPSEEAIDNMRYPMVAHFVHKADDGQLAVIGMLFAIGNENTGLAPILANIPKEENGKIAINNVNLPLLFARDKNYYSFMGSLTTPPCSEGVKWQVLKEPSEVSLSQLIEFKHLYPMNARPIQPINNRPIRVSQ